MHFFVDNVIIIFTTLQITLQSTLQVLEKIGKNLQVRQKMKPERLGICLWFIHRLSVGPKKQ